MRRRNTNLAVGLAALLTGATLTVSAQPAEAATVLNRFERSCYISCSPFVQVNGPYVSYVGSNCVTKSWFGSTSSYTRAAGQPC